MKRNESKSIISLVVAAVFALLAAGCASVPFAEVASVDEFFVDYLPLDRGTGTE